MLTNNSSVPVVTPIDYVGATEDDLVRESDYASRSKLLEKRPSRVE